MGLFEFPGGLHFPLKRSAPRVGRTSSIPGRAYADAGGLKQGPHSAALEATLCTHRQRQTMRAAGSHFLG
ncbi:hypothetical protein MTO96_010368 [Rhipicephalus appendiculatus]